MSNLQSDSLDVLHDIGRATNSDVQSWTTSWRLAQKAREEEAAAEKREAARQRKAEEREQKQKQAKQNKEKEKKPKARAKKKRGKPGAAAAGQEEPEEQDLEDLSEKEKGTDADAEGGEPGGKEDVAPAGQKKVRSRRRFCNLGDLTEDDVPLLRSAAKFRFVGQGVTPTVSGGDWGAFLDHILKYPDIGCILKPKKHKDLLKQLIQEPKPSSMKLYQHPNMVHYICNLQYKQYKLNTNPKT